VISVTVRMSGPGGLLDVYIVDTYDIRVALLSAIDAAEREHSNFKIQGVECGVTIGKVIPASSTSTYIRSSAFDRKI